RLSSCKFVGSHKVAQLAGIDLTSRRIFVIAEHLARGDLPDVVASQPGISHMITCTETLSEDGFGFIDIITQDRSISVNQTLGFGDGNLPGIAVRERSDISD